MGCEVKKHLLATSLAASFALFALLLAGCSKKTGADGAGGSSSVAAGSVQQAQETQLPPQRIVTLSPAATEILFAIGASDQIVAVSEFSDFPEEAAEKPVVGGFDGKTLSMEKILSYKPDFLYMTEGMHNFLIEQLESYGIAYYLSRGDSIKAVQEEIVEIGKITGHEIKARAVAERITQECGAIYHFENPITVYYEVWNSPFMTAGTRSFINDVISKAGGMNIFADVEEPYPIVSEESIIARAPDVILLPYSNGISPDDVKARAGWQDIPAIKNNRVYLINDNKYSRPASRIGECVLDLNGLLAN
jgi:iron complex transport system substrate-binding protein